MPTKIIKSKCLIFVFSTSICMKGLTHKRGKVSISWKYLTNNAGMLYFQLSINRPIISCAAFLAQITLLFPLAVPAYLSLETQDKSVYLISAQDESVNGPLHCDMLNHCLCSVCVHVCRHTSVPQHVKPRELVALFIATLAWVLQTLLGWLGSKPQDPVSNFPALGLQASMCHCAPPLFGWLWREDSGHYT